VDGGVEGVMVDVEVNSAGAGARSSSRSGSESESESLSCEGSSSPGCRRLPWDRFGQFKIDWALQEEKRGQIEREGATNFFFDNGVFVPIIFTSSSASSYENMRSLAATSVLGKARQRRTEERRH
jgi:hypothetical protein